MTSFGLFMMRLRAVVIVLIIWEGAARSGLLYNDVVPQVSVVVAALFALLSDSDVYFHLGWTALEAGMALAIGGIAGIAVGILLGANRFLQKAYEPYLYYLGATPKLIFFPIMIMWFGIGPSSKVALAAITCFFPIALSTLGGMHEIEQVYIRVGRSFKASTAQMVAKVYFPAMRQAVFTGVKLGFGLALVVTLLAETKIANRGLGFLVIQAFNIFDMPRMYALLITTFIFAIGANVLLSRLESGKLSNRPVNPPMF